MRNPISKLKEPDERTRQWQQRMLLLAGQAALLSQKAARQTFRHLWDAEVSIFSQWGEDGILDYLCDSLDIAKPNVIEFGVGDFAECNSRFLAEHRNATVWAIDAHANLEEQIQGLDISWRSTVIPIQEWITPDTGAAIMDDARNYMKRIDIVSIDLDGNDYWILERLNLRDVQILVVEYNPLFGSRLPVSIPRDDGFNRTRAHFSWLYFGASLRAFVELAAQRGFAFVGTNRVGNNAFFVPRASAHLDLEMPGEDLSPFTHWRVRESRSQTGALSYWTLAKAQEELSELPLVRTDDQTRLTVASTYLSN